VAVSVILWATAAYFVQQQIVRALLRPAHNQQFIYTSVGGGIDFLVRVCIYTGIVLSIPVIVFQILKYVQPLIKRDAARFIGWGSVVSGFLALAGMAFGYFLGLPSALHFLLHQFTTDQIHPLLTIQSYMSFVTMYMLGSALLFQLPLLLVLINRIKPLQPKKLLGYERWVILLAFVGGGIMNPSPRVQDQIMLAGPMIAAYQVGVIIVWLTNRRGRRAKWLTEMIQKDAELQALRRSRFQEAQAARQQHLARTAGHQTPAVPSRPTAKPIPVQFGPAAQPAAASPAQTTGSTRPRPYFNDFGSRRPAYNPLTPDSPETAV
jgi:sec-independent protein translocase protein TatC